MLYLQKMNRQKLKLLKKNDQEEISMMTKLRKEFDSIYRQFVASAFDLRDQNFFKKIFFFQV